MFERILNIVSSKKFLGMKKIKKDGESIYFKIDLLTTKENIFKFLSSLPDNYQLNFFDNFYPQKSDPGAYVWTQHLNSDKFAYSLHNHGWSSEWKEMNKNVLAEYIFKNREFMDGYFYIYPWKKKAELGKTIGEY
jgi:hypothetical protein